MKKILFIIGTKPEAIKLLPLIKKCKNYHKIKICLTNQHPNINRIIKEDDCITLNLIRNENGLSGLTGKILELLDKENEIKKFNPDLIIVHGDTTSSLCGCLYAFYEKIKLFHVESGLRTNDKYAPFPEEINRRIIDSFSDVNLCPTNENKKNLAKENIIDNVYVVGNTIIDYLKNKENKEINLPELLWINNEPFAIATLHRRESWGGSITKSINLLSDFAKKNKYKIIYISNNNKSLKQDAEKILNNNEFVLLSDPLEPNIFQALLSKCEFVVTDSGGIQEEAVYYQKPIIILRKNTERIEILQNNCGILANNDTLLECLMNIRGNKFNKNSFLFGEGNSSDKIISLINNL